MIDRDKLDALRELSREYHRLMRAGMPSDEAQIQHVAELTGFLACSVDYLLDEIERSRDSDQADRPRIATFAKMDRHRGSA